jgi:hypothetical protein
MATRSSILQHPTTDPKLRPLGKNWPQAFYKRHPELRSQRLKPIDWKRDDRYIREKIHQWFAVIGRELVDPGILLENVYNMDEAGVLLSVLNLLKVLVGKHDLREHRGGAVKRTLVDHWIKGRGTCEGDELRGQSRSTAKAGRQDRLAAPLQQSAIFKRHQRGREGES